MTLYWHIFHGHGGISGEYATDEGGDFVYLITGTEDDGWTLHEQHTYGHNINGKRLIESIEIWCFDRMEQARQYAGVLYRDKKAKEARAAIHAVEPRT